MSKVQRSRESDINRVCIGIITGKAIGERRDLVGEAVAAMGQATAGHRLESKSAWSITT